MENKRNEVADLLLRVRAGDQKAFADLLAAYGPLLRSEVTRYAVGFCEADADELRQEAALALYRAALAYDLSREEVEFGLYAKICLSNALVSCVRTLRKNREADVLLPELPDTEGDEGEDPARQLMEEEAAAELYARIRSVLSPYENRVWALYMAGLSAAEIAKSLGREPRSIENAVYRIRRKLRAALGGT